MHGTGIKIFRIFEIFRIQLKYGTFKQFFDFLLYLRIQLMGKYKIFKIY